MASKTITMRIPEDHYQTFAYLAKADNRPLSNFIETAALRYVEQTLLADDAEMKEIVEDKALMERIRKGHESAGKGRGRFV